MTILDHPREISVTDATQRGVAGIISDAEAGDIIVTRRSRPVAAIVSVERLERIQSMLDDLRDLTLAASRVLTDDGTRISFDDLLAAYGYSQEDLDAIPDDANEATPGADG
jgi:prevent-host-death family protein